MDTEEIAVQKKKSNKSNLKEWLITILVFLVVFVFIRNFIGISVVTNGESMAPTTTHGDRLFVEKLSYFFTDPQANDIIVFPVEEEDKKLIKRIIGVEGDTIDIIDNYFYVNDVKLEDDFSDVVINLGNVEFPITVGEDEYFVLGDNRNISQDSRYEEVGLIQKDDIIGKVVFRYYPFSKIGFIE